MTEEKMCEQIDEPELVPITEWSDDLVGKRVVVINDSITGVLEKGDIHTIKGRGRAAITCEIDNTPDGYTPLLSRFALAQNQDTPSNHKLGPGVEEIMEIGRRMLEEINSTLPKIKPNTSYVEITHSAKFEFPNGDIMEIPGPEGDGWKKEEVLEISSWKPTFYQDMLYLHGWEFPSINHTEGQIIYGEYSKRMSFENPKMLELSKWTRTVVVTAQEPEEQYPAISRIFRF